MRGTVTPIAYPAFLSRIADNGLTAL